MPSSARPSFGKRKPPPPAARPAPSPAAPAYPTIPTASAEEREATRPGPVAVPRSFRAAMLAGLIVGFCLAGLDITQAGTLDPALAALIGRSGLFDAAAQARPALMMLSLLGGARAAATTLLVAHRLLDRTGKTGYAAYAAGGAAVALAYGLLVFALGHSPRHGWLVETAAGAASGFFYRMFAGVRFP